MKTIFLGIAIALPCTFMGIVIDRYILWEPNIPKHPVVYKVETGSMFAPLQMDCRAANVQMAKEVLHICYKRAKQM